MANFGFYIKINILLNEFFLIIESLLNSENKVKSDVSK